MQGNVVEEIEGVEGDDYEDYEEEVDDVDEEGGDAPGTGNVRVTPEQNTPEQGTPGKVFIPAPVLSMQMRSPETELVTSKNTFEVTGVWTPSTLSSIKITYPTLSSDKETTNDLTRDNNPDKRFWKGGLTFRYANWTSDTIRFNNVSIPRGKGPKYGVSFVNMAVKLGTTRIPKPTSTVVVSPLVLFVI
jgi:hypothetical protein